MSSAELTEALAIVRRVIATQGHAVVALSPEPGESFPPVAHTVGLWQRYRHPELVVAALPEPQARLVLGVLASRVAAGERFGVGTTAANLLEGKTLGFVDLALAVYPVALMLDYYQVAVPMRRVLYTDAEGRWPWQRAPDDPWREAHGQLHRPAFCRQDPQH